MTSGQISSLRLPKEIFASQGPEILPGLPLSPGIVAMLDSERSAALRGEGPMPPDPFTAGQLSKFLIWIQKRNPESLTGLPRYMEALYNERVDLQKAMPQVAHGDLGAFAWWSYMFGRFEVPSFRLFGHFARGRGEIRDGRRVNDGVDVIGFLNAEHGIGEASRLLIEALESSEVPVSKISYRNTQSRQKVFLEADDVGVYKTIIAAVNAELNRPVREQFGSEFFEDTYVVGQWFWELEVAPDWYKDSYQYVDELWAPTKFIEEMLRREAPDRIPVHHMPLPLRKPRVVENAQRSDLELDDRFMFLFTFDFMSVMKRKNPLGLVEAFKKAFALNEGPMLVLKSINGETRPEGFAELMKAIDGREDIILMNKYLDSHQSASLMNLCDCYVSLHRSEGLGLTIAEAMLLGKPVIATNYSGNLDFMKPETSYLVSWDRVKVGEGAEAYDSNATWAEPNLDEAASLMRQVYLNPDQAKEKALAGKKDLEERFTPEITGLRMKKRLEEIWEVLNV
jgi:glycosyltransferase involved in cell wall biosynthesis